jgi:outer membrane lipoprotein-sorting protein
MLLASLLLSSCVSRRRVVPQEQRLLPALTSSRADLMRQLEQRSKAIQTMTATVTLDASGGALKTGVLTEYRQTKGFVLVDRPNHIRIRAQAPLALATVFDMVSDGRQYRVSIPLRNKFIVGETDAPANSLNPVLNLRPQHIMDALFIAVDGYIHDPQIRSTLEETVVGRSSYYVFHFISIAGREARLVEKLWIDRSNLEVARKQIFTDDGKVATDVEFANYQAAGDITFPQVIVIQRPIEDYMLRMTFQKTSLNEKLASDAFLLERPSGAELVQLNP